MKLLEGICDHRVPFGALVFRQVKAFQRKPLPALLFFKCLQLNEYNKAARVDIACPELLQGLKDTK